MTAALGGLFFGTLLALARLSPAKWLSTFAGSYVNLMRSIPLVLVIFWFFFLMPEILQWATHAERPVQIGAERLGYPRGSWEPLFRALAGIWPSDGTGAAATAGGRAGLAGGGTFSGGAGRSSMVAASSA